MSQRRFCSIGLTLAIALTAACGGSKPAPAPEATPAAETAPQTVQQAAVAKGMEQFAQGLQQMGQNKTATAVDFEQLVALLPEVDGWERSKPRGEQFTMGIATSNANASYTKGESSVDLEITDSSFNQLILAPFSMYLVAGFSERSTEGYKKGATIGGQPGFESWQNDSRRAEVTAVVANRFVVQATGRNVDSADAVKAFVQAVDFSKLTALK
jgi:hypothetical protein